jgi:hypothetical protein
MSLTSHIRRKTPVYWHIINMLDDEHCQSLIEHHRSIVGKPVHPAVTGTNFPLAGMAVIYAFRDYLGGKYGKYVWEETVAGQLFPYPGTIKESARAVVMALMDGHCREGSLFSVDVESIVSQVAGLEETIEDVARIAEGFSSINPYRLGHLVVNPNFAGSDLVGGADANLITATTLWSIRTTTQKAPLTLDNIVQQVGYYLLDFDNQYQLDEICWYYIRQQKTLCHPIQPMLSASRERFKQKLSVLVTQVKERYQP